METSRSKVAYIDADFGPRGGKQNWKRKADPRCLEPIDSILPEGERFQIV
jgi:hypothetical protein